MADKKWNMPDLETLAKRGGSPQPAPQTTVSPQYNAPDLSRLNKYADPKQFFGPRMMRDEPGERAGAGDVFLASSTPDVQTKINYYSKVLGIPADQFGVAGGQIVYMRPDGSLQPVEAGTLNQLARGTNEAIPAATGMVGGVLGTVGGPVGVAGGGVLGAAAGQEGRNLMAEFILDEDISAFERLQRTAFEAGMDLAGFTAGHLVGKGLTKVQATKFSKDLVKRLKAGGEATADVMRQAVRDLNKKYNTNVFLTWAELTNDPQLRSIQMALQQQPTDIGVRMTDRAVDNADQLGKVIDDVITDISPIGDNLRAGRIFSGRAGDVQRNILEQRKTRAGAAYEQAYANAPTIDMQPFLDYTEVVAKEFPYLKGPLRKAMRFATTERGVPLSELRQVQDQVKETLDIEIERAARKSGKLATRLGEVRNALVDRLGQMSPEWDAARRLWGQMSEQAKALDGSWVNILGNTSPRDFENVGYMFFSSAGPKEIARVRKQLMSVRGGEAAFNAAARGYMTRLWDKAQRVTKSAVGDPMKERAASPIAFWADTMGNKQVRAKIFQMLPEQNWKAFDNLMNVVKASSVATNWNSTTPAQQAAKDLVDDIGLGGNLIAAGAGLNPLRVSSAASDAARDVLRGKNQEVLFEMLTNPGSAEELAKIAKGAGDGWLNPRNMTLVAKAANIARGFIAGSTREYQDRVPEGATAR